MAVTTLSLRQRTNLAFSVLRGRVRPASKGRGSFEGLVWPFFRGGQPAWRTFDYQTLVEEGYNTNALIYAAIGYKMDAKTMAPLRAWTGTLAQREPADPAHPLAQLVSRPNPHQSPAEFEDLNVGYLSLSGNSYTAFDRPNPNALPEAMYALRPDRVTIIPNPRNSKEILGYFYVPAGATYANGVPVLAQDMMHVKRANLLDPLDGLGEGTPPVSASAKSIDVDNAVTDFLKIFFEHGAVPMNVVTSSEPLDGSVIARFQDRWMEIYGNYRNWVKPLVLGGENVKFHKLGMSFDEMGFEALDERNETRVLMDIGVPAVLVGARVGLKLATNRATVEGLRKTYWEDRFIPELTRFEQEYQYYLKSDDGVFVAYDLSGVPALALNVDVLTGSAKRMWDMGTPANQATSAVGLTTVGDIPGGDVGYIPLGVVPSGVSFTEERGEEEAPGATEEERKFWAARALGVRGYTLAQKQAMLIVLANEAELAAAEGKNVPDWYAVRHRWEAALGRDLFETERAAIERASRHAALPLAVAGGLGLVKQERRGFSDEAKARLAKQVNRRVDSWVPKFAARVTGQMRVDERELLAIINKERRKSLEKKQTVNWDNVNQDWTAYYAAEGDDAWQETFFPLVRGVVEDQGDFWLDQLDLGVQFNLRNLPAEEWFAGYMLKFAQPINQTTLDDLHKLITQALENGWTILTEQEIQWFVDRSPRYRRENIARTESQRASNSGTFQLYEDWRLPGHEWLTVVDGRERPEHRGTNGQVRNVGEAFNVGGEGSPIRMLHPMDSSLGAPMEQIYQCRCVTIPVLQVE
jgi:HK97 family phage portal protein